VSFSYLRTSVIDHFRGLVFRIFSKLSHYCTLESFGKLKNVSLILTPIAAHWSNIDVGGSWQGQFYKLCRIEKTYSSLPLEKSVFIPILPPSFMLVAGLTNIFFKKTQKNLLLLFRSEISGFLLSNYFFFIFNM
jgi:hypothetical protein